ncbi:MAG: GPH family glycoside/pentoside/hexuronide:cation symporter [Alcanivorax sp.]
MNYNAMLNTQTRICYGIGGGVYAIKEAAYNTFILLFYVQVLGLSGLVTGAVIAISLLWDAVSDPLVGSWSDRLRSRYGRRHPFMVYSTLPVAIGFIGLFAPPSAVTESSTLLACWLLFWSLWVRTFITTFSIPHLALSAELTSEYNERSELLGLRLGFLFLIVLILPALALVLVFGADQEMDGRFIAENYPMYGLMSAGLAIVLGVITVVGTRRHTSRPDANGENYALPSLKNYIGDVSQTFGNKIFRTIVCFEIAASIAWGSVATLYVMVGTYVFEFSAIKMAITMAVPGVLAVALVWLLLKSISRRWQKPQILRYSLWGMVFDTLWLLPLKLADMLPPNDSLAVLGLYLLQVTIFSFFFLLRVTSSTSIVADITDQHELEEGGRKEGGFFSVLNFTAKMASLVGPLYGGIALDVIGLNRQDLPGEVAQPVLAGLMYSVMLIGVPALLIALRYAYKLQFSKEQFDDIQATLRDRFE